MENRSFVPLVDFDSNLSCRFLIDISCVASGEHIPDCSHSSTIWRRLSFILDRVTSSPCWGLFCEECTSLVRWATNEEQNRLNGEK